MGCHDSPRSQARRPLSHSQIKREESLKRQTWGRYRAWSRITVMGIFGKTGKEVVMVVGRSGIHRAGKLASTLAHYDGQLQFHRLYEARSALPRALGSRARVQAHPRLLLAVATAFLTLGPSNGHATIKLASVYTKTEAMTMLKKMEAMADPGAIRIDAVTEKGTDVATGKPIERTYNAAP